MERDSLNSVRSSLSVRSVTAMGRGSRSVCSAKKQT